MFDFGAECYHAFFYGIYQGGNKRKTEYVDYKENGVRNFFIYTRKNGERAIEIRAYIEHIEIVRGHKVVENNVLNKRRRGKYGENDHTPGEEALV